MKRKMLIKEVTGNNLTVNTEVVHPSIGYNLEWVVGTVGNGIIICETLCTKPDIEDGSVFDHLAFYVLGSDVRDPHLITWYIYSNPGAVSSSTCHNYRKYLNDHPEVGFLTIYEVGQAKHFLSINIKSSGKTKVPENEVRKSLHREEPNPFMKFVDAKKYGPESYENETGQAGMNLDDTVPEPAMAPEYSIKKGYELDGRTLETDFNMLTSENEDVVSRDGSYFRIFSRDKDGQITKISEHSFFYDKKLVNDTQGLEEAAVKMLALRCANLMCPEDFQTIPWQFKDSDHSTCINIYKIMDSHGKYAHCNNKASFEIMIYRPRNYRQYISVSPRA